ncbi:ATP-binding protein [Bacteroides zoogleoformans]|uniref:ATP-binding protein n=1 Tax=Bacteroides zoogleoformans TaxID=28119 RepID=UPI00248EF519|nr:ATP-binding protein [Bacteroides zoogleoformans]
MKDTLRKPENAERLLKMTADTMLILDEKGTCVDMAVYNIDLWFMKEEILLGKNLFDVFPASTCEQFYPDFKKVLKYKIRSANNYAITLKGITYYFKCIMYPFDGMVLCQYRDITERSQRKLELEKRNHELNEIQKAALIGRWQYDSDTALFSYIGHTGVMCSDELQYIHQDHYLEAIIPEDRESFRNWLKDNLKGKMENNIDYRLLFKKKIYYIRLKTFARECHKDGNITLEGYIQNITDIKKRRNDINLLTHAINNSTEDIYSAHEDGTLIFCNRRFKERHQIDENQDISTLKVYDLPTFVRDKKAWKTFAATVKRGELTHEYILHNPIPQHPEVLAIEGNAYWVTSDKGEGTVWAFGRDVSTRIRQEQQIKQFNQILDKIMENLPAGIVVKDINNEFKYIYRNREAYNGAITVQSISGKDDFDFYPPEVALQKRKEDIEIAQTGQEKHWIAEKQDAKGSAIYLDKRKIKVESNDFPPFLLDIEWDITEMEQMKRELMVAKEKAETSDRLKSAFLANMSHEIRTPLNAIVGFSGIIAESSNAEERLNYYKIVEANNERLLQLINEILDLSKIESGFVEFTIAPICLHKLCKELHEALTFRCPQEVQLIFEESDASIVIDGDKNRLFQVISNLISNAFKFTISGSITYGYRREGDEVRFYVTDTGLGIAPDKVEHIFDRFVKANDFAQGTGLGLSICKIIIERLGGRISVSSEFGKGTTFTFFLPIESADKKATKETVSDCCIVEPIVPTGKAATEVPLPFSEKDMPAVKTKENNDSRSIILVAEDTDSNYVLIKAILENNYRLERAKDGMEAVTMFENTHPALILMDIKMPNLDGLDATRIIREISPDIPIIALTAYAYESDRQAAFDAGCSDFLAKPFKIETLKELVKKWLK